MSRNKIIIGVVCFLILLLLIALVWGSFFFYNMAIGRNDKSHIFGGGEEVEQDEEEELAFDEEPFNANWINEQGYDTWEIVSNDGLKLKAYYVKSKNPTAKTAIIAHGYSSNAKDMSSYGQMFNENLGYNVLLPDARGHGESEGDYIGFGWPERKDYLQWIDKIIEVNGNESEIVLFGVSMGGATVMMTSGEELPIQVKSIIEDCGYSSVDKELKFQLKSMFNIPSFPILQTTSLLTKIRAGYGFYEASSVKQVAKSKVPILFIHGSNDTFVPTDMIYDVYEACNSEKDLYIVEGAVHGMAYYTDKEGYENKVREFIEKY